MRTILKIARTELRVLFFSPVAWLILAAFMVHTGFQLTDLMKNFVRSQESGYKMTQLTMNIFTNPEWGFLPNLLGSLYFYVPLLTMGVMSRELHSGSIKLLLSSPVGIGEVVLGKFVSLAIYNLLLVLVLGALVVAASISIVALDVPALLAALLGIYLLMTAYAAIGLFMSSLTSYQVVAAISTLAVLAALNYVTVVGQRVDWFRPVSYYLSLAGRTNHFMMGLLSSMDLAYFLLVIAAFLLFTGLRLYNSRDPKPMPTKIARYAVVTAGFLALTWLTSRPSLIAYGDLTVNKSNTLAPVTRQLADSVTQPVTVTLYSNLFHRFHYGLPENRIEDVELWRPYLRFMPDMQFQYVNYYDPTPDDPYEYYKNNRGISMPMLAQRLANVRDYDLSDLTPPGKEPDRAILEKEKFHTIRVVKSGDAGAVLHFFNEMDPQPSESEIAAAFKRLRTGPMRIAYLTGNSERNLGKADDREYKDAIANPEVRSSLVNQGFEIDAVDLDKDSIPANTGILVLGDPATPLSPTGLGKIGDYLDHGGNMLINTGAGRQNIIDPVLKGLGWQLREGEVVQESLDFTPDYLQTWLTGEAAGLTTKMSRMRTDSAKIVLRQASLLQPIEPPSHQPQPPSPSHQLQPAPPSYQPQPPSPSPWTVTPLLVTDPKNTWNKASHFAGDTGKVVYNASQGDDRSAAPLAIALTRQQQGRTQRVMVFGSAEWLSNREMGKFDISNSDLKLQVFQWLSNDRYPVDVSRPLTKDTRFLVSHDQVASMQLLFAVILPALLLLGGAIQLIRRSRT